MLMVRGDLTSFDLKDGQKIELPDDFGMVHDPVGITLDRCTVYLCKCKYLWNKSVTIHKSIEQDAYDYFGDGVDLVNATVAIPEGPWHFLGVVETIHYERYGKHPGPWYHPFSDRWDGVELYKSECMVAYMLQLPDGCIITEHGYVKP